MIIKINKKDLGYLMVLAVYFKELGLVIIDDNQPFSIYTAGVKTGGNGPLTAMCGI